MVACLSHQLQGPDGSRKNGRDFVWKPPEVVVPGESSETAQGLEQGQFGVVRVTYLPFALCLATVCQTRPNGGGCTVRHRESDIVTPEADTTVQGGRRFA